MTPKKKERIHCKGCDELFDAKLPLTPLGRYCKKNKCYQKEKKRRNQEFIKNNQLEEDACSRREKPPKPVDEAGYKKEDKEELPVEIEEATVEEEVPVQDTAPPIVPELGPPAATLTCDNCKKDFHVYDARKKNRRWCLECAPTPADSNRLGAIHGPRKHYKPRARKTKPAGIKKSDDLWYRARYEKLCKDLEKLVKTNGMVIKQKVERRHIAPYLNKVEEKVKEIVEKTFGLMGLEMLKKIDWQEEWKAIDKL